MTPFCMGESLWSAIAGGNIVICYVFLRALRVLQEAKRPGGSL